MVVPPSLRILNQSRGFAGVSAAAWGPAGVSAAAPATSLPERGSTEEAHVIQILRNAAMRGDGIARPSQLARPLWEGLRSLLPPRSLKYFMCQHADKFEIVDQGSKHWGFKLARANAPAGPKSRPPPPPPKPTRAPPTPTVGAAGVTAAAAPTVPPGAGFGTALLAQQTAGVTAAAPTVPPGAGFGTALLAQQSALPITADSEPVDMPWEARDWWSHQSWGHGGDGWGQWWDQDGGGWGQGWPERWGQGWRG